jgi:hypothetical protein
LRNQKTATEVGSFINFRSRKIKFIYYLHHSYRVIENPTTITRNICLFEFRHPKVIDRRKHSFEERTQPLRNISQRSRAGCTDKSRFNWVFMKLQNHRKKWEMRATLNTFKSMSLIKREMKFQNIRLGKLETTYVPTGELSSEKIKET